MFHTPEMFEKLNNKLFRTAYGSLRTEREFVGGSIILAKD